MGRVRLLVCGVAVDAGHIYWGDRLKETIGRAKVDGSQVEPEFIKSAHQACGIAVGPTYAYYMTDTGTGFKILRTGLGAPGPIVDTFTATPTGDCATPTGPPTKGTS